MKKKTFLNKIAHHTMNLCKNSVGGIITIIGFVYYFCVGFYKGWKMS